MTVLHDQENQTYADHLIADNNAFVLDGLSIDGLVLNQTGSRVTGEDALIRDDI